MAVDPREPPGFRPMKWVNDITAYAYTDPINHEIKYFEKELNKKDQGLLKRRPELDMDYGGAWVVDEH